jgi:Flp pilus assembly protein TadD
MTESAAWLEDFAADPAACLDALLRGRVTVSPWGRYDPADVLSFLFKPPGVGVVAVLDRALADWLAARVGEGPERRGPLPLSYAAAVEEAFSAALRLPVPATRALLRRRMAEFTRLAQDLSEEGRDLRRLLWMALAAGQDGRGLLGHWYRLCDRAGADYPEDYLEVALLGLRRLPRRDDGYDLGDEVLFGLARWARRLGANDRPRFTGEWRALAALYPRGREHWPVRLAPILAAHRGHPFARWWAEEVGMDLPAPARVPARQMRGDDFWKEIRGLDIPELRCRVEAFMAANEAYADSVMNAEDLGIGFHVVGTRLLDRAPDLSLALAEAGIERKANGAYMWGLKADALVALGRPAAAEDTLWEAVEVVHPDDAHCRNQLAGLLERQGRVEEGEALYRRTLSRCPDNPAAPAALAHLLAERDRLPEAERLLRRAVTDFADNPFFPTALAGLLVEAGRWREAEDLYRKTLRQFPTNGASRLAYGIELVWRDRVEEAEALVTELRGIDRSMANVLAGHIKTKRAGRLRQQTENDDDIAPPAGGVDLSAAGQALRAGFLMTAMNDNAPLVLSDRARRAALRAEAEDAVRAALAAHPNHPLVRLIAARHRLAPAAVPDEADALVAIELARRAADEKRFAALAEAHADLAPLVWLAWLAADLYGSAEMLRAWLARGPAPGDSPALADMRRRLDELLPGCARMDAGEFADSFDEKVGREANAILDLALLRLADLDAGMALAA